MKNIFALGMALVMTSGVFAVEDVVIDEDFEGGTTDFVNWLRVDYDDVPTVASGADADFPGSSPAPSGTQYLRVADDDNSIFGLSGAHASGEASVAYYVYRNSPGFVSATVQADIYLDTSTGNTEHNFALAAVEDADGPGGNGLGAEAYYRFGYRNGEIYLDIFDSAGTYGSSGTTSLGAESGTALAATTLPGWNEFRLTFDASDNIRCFVNGTEADFSPINDNTLPYFTVGGIGFNIDTQDPLLMDDVILSYEPGTVPAELSVFDSE